MLDTSFVKSGAYELPEGWKGASDQIWSNCESDVFGEVHFLTMVSIDLALTTLYSDSINTTMYSCIACTK